MKRNLAASLASFSRDTSDTLAISAIDSTFSNLHFPVSIAQNIPPFREMIASQCLPTDHFLADLITKPKALHSREIERVLCNSRIDLAIITVGNGIVPAASNGREAYGRHAWNGTNLNQYSFPQCAS